MRKFTRTEMLTRAQMRDRYVRIRSSSFALSPKDIVGCDWKGKEMDDNTRSVGNGSRGCTRLIGGLASVELEAVVDPVNVDPGIEDDVGGGDTIASRLCIKARNCGSVCILK
jgi:hypothetical protein